MGVAEKNKGLPGIGCPTPVDASCVESAVSRSSTTMRHATCPSEQKVAKLRYQQFIYMTNADIVILHPFFCLISAVSRSSTHPGWYRLSTRLSTPHVSYRLSPVRRHLMCHMYEMIIAGTRFVLPIMSFVICHECQLKFGH